MWSLIYIVKFLEITKVISSKIQSKPTWSLLVGLWRISAPYGATNAVRLCVRLIISRLYLGSDKFHSRQANMVEAIDC